MAFPACVGVMLEPDSSPQSWALHFWSKKSGLYGYSMDTNWSRTFHLMLPTYFLRLRKKESKDRKASTGSLLLLKVHSFWSGLTLMGLSKIFVFGSSCHSFFNLNLRIGKRKSLKMPDKDTIGTLRLMCIRPILWILKSSFERTKASNRHSELEIVSRVRSERKKKNWNRQRSEQFRKWWREVVRERVRRTEIERRRQKESERVRGKQGQRETKTDRNWEGEKTELHRKRTSVVSKRGEKTKNIPSTRIYWGFCVSRHWDCADKSIK